MDFADQMNISCLDHGIGCFNRTNQALSFPIIPKASFLIIIVSS